LFNFSCVTDSLVISDGISTETYCGGTSLQRTYSFETCSNTFTINYSTSSSFSIRRGFRAYYEGNINFIYNLNEIYLN